MTRSNQFHIFNVRSLTAAAWLFVTAVTAWGAAPLGKEILYQGRLDLDGTPVSDTCSFQFSLWDAVNGGAQVGPTLLFDSDGNNAITVTDGLFTALLDFGPDVFTGQALWLEIAVKCPPDPNYTTLDPRQPLTAAPYALYALNGPGSGTASAQQLISGTWLLESGGMLPTFVQGLATFSVTADVTGIVLNPSGLTGRVFMRDRLTEAKDSLRAYVLFDGNTLVFDFAAEPTTDVVFNIALDVYTFLFPVVVKDNDMLGIADEAGQIALFSSQSVLPADVILGDLQVVDRFDNLPSPQFFSDIILYNGDLAYNGGSTGQIETFDLDTDTLGTPLGATSSRLVQTAQGGFFWTHCGCGGSRDMFKRTISLVFDTVSSETEMGGPITFRAAAYNATTDRLWLHGRPFDSQFGQFYVMNTNGEPDVIDQTISFNRDLRGLAFDGAELWGIITVASQAIVHIDTTTGKVIETYNLPDEDVSYSGIVFDATYMYLLGTTLDGDGVLFRLNKP